MLIEDERIYISPDDLEPDNLEECFAVITDYREGLADRFERAKTSQVLYNETIEMILEEGSLLSLLALYAMSNTGIFNVVIDGDPTARKIVRKSGSPLKSNRDTFINKKHAESDGGKASARKRAEQKAKYIPERNLAQKVDAETGEVTNEAPQPEEGIQKIYSETFGELPF